MKNKDQILILERFPKIRKELPPEFRAIYETHYKKNREGKTNVTSLSMRMERWLHKKVAEDVLGLPHDVKTLEIGAGTLNQLEFEPGLSSYDIVEPFTSLYENSAHKHRVKNNFLSIHDISPDHKYPRITSVATFEHIPDLPAVVAKAALLLEENGVLRVSIPNEGTVLWKWGTLITGAEFKKTYHLDYQVLMRYEHINTADEIEEVLKYFFKKVRVNVYGISRKIAFYRFFCCSEPHRERAGEYLSKDIK
jgi:hypothetical protein